MFQWLSNIFTFFFGSKPGTAKQATPASKKVEPVKTVPAVKKPANNAKKKKSTKKSK